MEKNLVRPLIIRTTSGEDFRYAEEEEGISMAELQPLTGGTSKGSVDAKTAIGSRSTNLYVKGPSRGSPDIKYIEEDESESELLSISGIHSRESSTAPAGDLVEYDVEELNKMLLSTPGTTSASTLQPPSAPEKKSEQTAKKKDSIVTIVEENAEGNRIVHKPEKSGAHSDSANEHTYSVIKDDFSPFRLLSRQPSVKSSSSYHGEGGRRLHSSASAEGRDEEEIFLESLRQVVRKCTNVDPRKRPSSLDVLEILSLHPEKS